MNLKLGRFTLSLTVAAIVLAVGYYSRGKTEKNAPLNDAPTEAYTHSPDRSESESQSRATAMRARPPEVFGLTTGARLESLPSGPFQKELRTLSPALQRDVLHKLEQLRIPLGDLASLHIDSTGQLYYECSAAPAPAGVKSEEDGTLPDSLKSPT